VRSAWTRRANACPPWCAIWPRSAGASKSRARHTAWRDAARLADVPFNHVILDEAQTIKNAATVSGKAVRLLNARHRLALSGTTIENHVGELWSLFEFLNSGLLGSATHGLVRRARAGDAGALDTLRQGLRPYILRRTKAQVAPDTVEERILELQARKRAVADAIITADNSALGDLSRQDLELLLS
jgi:SNF2 family DNA or RNA helicase